MKFITAGPKPAKVMLVGEAPSQGEIASGQPFTGGAGMMLQHMMSLGGMSMSACYRTNVVHVPAPRIRTGATDFKPFTKPGNPLMLEFLKGLAKLKVDIAEAKPNLIIGMGNFALMALTGKQGIDKYRGSILDCRLNPGTKVICTYSPGFPLKVWQAKAVMEMDFRRCAEDANFPEFRLPERQYFLNPGAGERQRIVEEMLVAEWLSVDIECLYDETTRSWVLTCVGFSDRPDRALVIPWGDAMQRLHIKMLVEGPAKKIYQNGTFDVMVMRRNGLRPTHYEWDTMYGHHALFAESATGEDEMSILAGKDKKTVILRKSLGFQTSIYTREPFYKDDGKVTEGRPRDWQEFYLYNGKDAAVTHEIKNAQVQELREWGSYDAARREVRFAQPAMFAAERGILIDLELRQRLLKDFNEEVDRLQAFLDAGAGRSVNVSSSKDMPWLLYEHLKLPVKTNRKTKNVTADKNAINDLMGKYPNPLLMTVTKIRELRKFIETYLNTEPASDRRMRCLEDPSGTKTGRPAGRTLPDGQGMNLLNIPVRKKKGALIRQMFISDPGKVFIQRDYKQAETWIVAYKSRSERLIELLNDPSRDIHRENAVRIYGVKLEEVTDEQRYLAKRTGHGSNYGLEGDRLKSMIDEDAETTGIRITAKQGDMLIGAYFAIYPEIQGTYWREVREQIDRTRTLSTSMGRKRAFYGDMRDWKARETLYRDAYSWEPQSTVGDLCIEAVIRCFEEIQLGHPEWEAEFLLTVYDSIMMQCKEEYVEEVANAMEECMKIPLTINGETFVIPSDCAVGHNWNKKGKDGSNPLGLQDIDKWLAAR